MQRTLPPVSLRNVDSSPETTSGQPYQFQYAYTLTDLLTKVESLRRTPHVLDWANMPDPFRDYEGLPVLELPADPPSPKTPALRVLQGSSGSFQLLVGLNVTWMRYRGPGKVTFENMDPILVNDGKVINRAMFSVPGTYVLRATANDGELSTTSDTTIYVGLNVNPGHP
jgi:hypothetical protein